MDFAMDNGNYIGGKEKKPKVVAFKSVGKQGKPMTKEEVEEVREKIIKEVKEIARMAEENEEYLDQEVSGPLERYTEAEIAEAEASMKEVLNFDADRIFEDTSNKALNQKELDRQTQISSIEEQIKLIRKQRNTLRNARRMRTLKIDIAMGKDIIKTLLKETAKKFGARAEKCAKDSLERKMLDKKWEEAITKINNVWHEEQEQNQKELVRLQKIESTIQDELSTYINDRKRISTEKKQIQQLIDRRNAEILINHYDEFEYARSQAISNNDTTKLIEVVRQSHQELEDYKLELAKEHNAENIDELLKSYDEKIKEVNSEIKERRRELKESQKDIQDCENRIDERDSKMNADMQEARDSIKISKLTLPKQSIFQKIVGNVFNRFGGKKKFEKEVIGNIESVINKLENEGLKEAKDEIIRLAEERQKREEEYYVKHAGEEKSWKDRKEESRERAEQIVDEKHEKKAQKRKQTKKKT